MTSPDTNAVTIGRTDGRVSARGGDEHTARFLAMTGFEPVAGAARSEAVLPDGLDGLEQAECQPRPDPRCPALAAAVRPRDR